MPRDANPFYYNADSQLGAALGATLGRALFGDPDKRMEEEQLRAKLGYMDAQTRQALAQAGLYDEQAEGVGIQNNASTSLPELIKGLFASAAPTAPAAPVDPLAPLPDAPDGNYYAGGAGATFNPQSFRDGLPALFASLGQMQGDKVDPNEMVAGLAAMFGDDEFARRGMVAQGVTPGERFAITPERADDIRSQEFNADYTRAVDVENIESDDRRYSADRSYQGRTYAADRSLDGKVYGVDNKDYDRAGAISLGNAFGVVTSTVRDEKKNRDVGGVSNSYHLPSRGGRGIDIKRKPGASHAQVVQAYRDAGYTILEELDEGDHSHLALAGGPKKPGKQSTPKIVSQPNRKALDEEIKTQLREGSIGADPGALNIIRSKAIELFQRTGNQVQAAADAIQWARRTNRRNASARSAPKPKPATGGSDLRRQALAAIAKGADAAKVRARFKQMTGRAL